MFCVVITVAMQLVSGMPSTQKKAEWDIGLSLGLGRALAVGDQWSSEKSIPYLLAAMEVIPESTQVIPGATPSGIFMDFGLFFRRPVSDKFHVQFQFGLIGENLATKSDPGGGVRLNWNNFSYHGGLLGGVQKNINDFVFSARLGLEIAVAFEDTLYLEVDKKRIGVFIDRKSDKIGPKFLTELTVKYVHAELGITAYRCFKDYNGIDGYEPQLFGLGAVAKLIY